MMEKLRIAFASDDEKRMTKEHFGEAKAYLVYEIGKEKAKLLNIVPNTSPEEQNHADPNKAKGVAGLLKPYGAQILVNKAFGGNIKRMQAKFVCVLSKADTIEESIKNIQNRFQDVVNEWGRGEERDFLRL